jgi:hypothetical protein
MAVPITQAEANQITIPIVSIFHQVLEDYDFRKYPAYYYAHFKTVFAALNPSNADIEAAMIWKWGHWGKVDFPGRHKELIRELQQLWPQFMASGSTNTPLRTFEWWKDRLNRQTTYITVAYITHLIHHAEPLPIIDQHNFRAMNALIRLVRPGGKPKKKPSNWADIQSLKSFMMVLVAAIPNLSFSDLDRFLMMYGRNCVNH